RHAGATGLANVFLYAVAPQREPRRPATRDCAGRKSACSARSGARREQAVWDALRRCHRALRPLPAPQRDPRPPLDAGGARLSRRTQAAILIRPQSGVPAKVGTHLSTISQAERWVPAFAGTRILRLFRPVTARMANAPPM